MIAWNLAEDMQASPTHLPATYFSPPIAAAIDPKSFTEVAQDPPATVDIYTLTETYVDDEGDADPAKHRTTEVTLAVHIAAGTYPTDPRFPNLPAGAVRIHTLSWGMVTFIPATATLALEMTVFGSQTLTAVPWWERWADAKRSPKVFYYDNVDVDALKALLAGMPDAPNGVHGLFFPRGPDGNPITDRTGYIDKFLLGNEGYFLGAHAGAVLGAAGPVGTNGEREVRFRARYSDDVPAPPATAIPSPMSPRELFYLAFGETSVLASQNPLFRRMNQITTLQRRPDNTIISSAGMIMRPPLRTWRRLIWEAEQEDKIDTGLRLHVPPDPQWGSSGDDGHGHAVTCSLGPDSLHDKKFRRKTSDHQSHSISFGPLDGVVKCNVFVGDLCVRAGFHTFIHEIRITQTQRSWHTIDAGSFCNLARQAIAKSGTLTDPEVAMNGSDAANVGKEWGKAVTRILTNVRPGDTAAKNAALATLNAMMQEKGRPLILAMCRKRQGNPPQGGIPDEAGCIHGVQVFKPRSGHIIFLETVTDFTTVANHDVQAPGLPAGGQMLSTINVTCSQAQSTSHIDPFGAPGGARTHLRYPVQLNGVANVAGDGKDYIRLHLLAPMAGGDPDLLHQLQDLHRQQTNLSSLETDLDRAHPLHINNSPQCCQDRINHAPVVGNC